MSFWSWTCLVRTPRSSCLFLGTARQGLYPTLRFRVTKTSYTPPPLTPHRVFLSVSGVTRYFGDFPPSDLGRGGGTERGRAPKRGGPFSSWVLEQTRKSPPSLWSPLFTTPTTPPTLRRRSRPLSGPRSTGSKTSSSLGSGLPTYWSRRGDG